MEDKTRYKYAVVRVKESAVVDFFGLIVQNGYSDVSFVSHLSQVTARADPNGEDSDQEKCKSQHNESGAEAEERCSLEGGTPSGEMGDEPENSPGAAGAPGEPAQSTLNHLIGQQEDYAMQIKKDPDDSQHSFQENFKVLPANDILQHLFSANMLPTEWPAELQFDSAGAVPMTTPSTVQYLKSQGQNVMQSGFQTRMKGWQREYIKEVINNGHYPTEEELRDIEQKCDLSRKQVLRFIAKRLVNPNRKPKAVGTATNKQRPEMFVGSSIEAVAQSTLAHAKEMMLQDGQLVDMDNDSS